MSIYGSVDLERAADRAARRAQVRSVSARAKAGRRGDGRGLPGRAQPAQAAVRPQADQARGGDRPDRHGPIRARSAVGRPAGAPQHDRNLRLRSHRRRDVLLCDGVPSGARAWPTWCAPTVRLPAGRVIYLFRQVCAGLAEAHGLGLVHRDLKPANVFVAVRGGESDVSKVLDFGLVKLTRDPGAANLTSDMTVSGTPMFMAPEQTVGDRSLDARADIYALGAMMYHALTGQPPFTGENAFAIMMAHSRDPVVPPSQTQSRRTGGPRAGGPALPGQEARGSIPERQGAGPGPGRLRRGFRMGRQPRRGVVGRRGVVRRAGRVSTARASPRPQPNGMSRQPSAPEPARAAA